MAAGIGLAPRSTSTTCGVAFTCARTSSRARGGRRLRGSIPALEREDVEFEVYHISPAGDFATGATRQSAGYDVRSSEARARPVAGSRRLPAGHERAVRMAAMLTRPTAREAFVRSALRECARLRADPWDLALATWVPLLALALLARCSRPACRANCRWWRWSIMTTARPAANWCAGSMPCRACGWPRGRRT